MFVCRLTTFGSNPSAFELKFLLNVVDIGAATTKIDTCAGITRLTMSQETIGTDCKRKVSKELVSEYVFNDEVPKGAVFETSFADSFSGKSIRFKFYVKKNETEKEILGEAIFDDEWNLLTIEEQFIQFMG